ncbi:glycosyltransferase family 2 protein [Panacibacter sp. DH6]|uniref:Glycosyltransferase family 2 protein n=1 Tax=Panacibacter microcysteis TaxID=2793269 RepID=A0A931E5S9_9BACT|nr:glycosyltransferase family 2 protein [Panacibacter microcysteis]MBG9376697.1 glycosyltransferase family 2 protein [Panacibacter microcysteis]
MIFFFWASLLIVFYTFIGYGILLFVLVKLRRLVIGRRRNNADINDLPTCTLIIASYNEADILREKISNTLALSYPEKKLSVVFVTDGSSDHSPQIINEYSTIKLLHSPERKGKIHAMHRAMQQVTTDITIFTDANTFLNKDALINIARHYADSSVGAVAGEKRVQINESADATAAEGFYWKYESALKKWDAELYSVVGAAGELFSIRTDLYIPVAPDTVLDDFMISLRIAEKGYRIVYEPEAYALETPSANIKEELKRKIRIAAGGIQSVLRLKSLLNPFENFVLSFQYISHRVLRWTITPFLLILAFILNIIIVFETKALFYELLLAGQFSFYLLAFSGWLLEQRSIRIKVLFIPYYFCVMNYAVLAGIWRYIFSEQKVTWEKAKRKS